MFWALKEARWRKKKRKEKKRKGRVIKERAGVGRSECKQKRWGQEPHGANPPFPSQRFLERGVRRAVPECGWGGGGGLGPKVLHMKKKLFWEEGGLA